MRIFPSPLMVVWPACNSAQRKNESQLQKLEATKYTWSLKLEGTRPTGLIGWLRLWPLRIPDILHLHPID